jgi:hypothetical protein
MPHSKPAESFFERSNGSVTLTMMAPPKIGLPYGSMPRLLMVWITTDKIDALLRKWLRLLPHPYEARDRRAGYRYQISISS